MKLYFKEADKMDWLKNDFKSKKGKLYKHELSGDDITKVEFVGYRTSYKYNTTELKYTFKNGLVCIQTMPTNIFASLLMHPDVQFDVQTNELKNCPFHFENVNKIPKLDYVAKYDYTQTNEKQILLVPTLLYPDKEAVFASNLKVSTKDISKDVFDMNYAYLTNNICYVPYEKPYKSTILQGKSLDKNNKIYKAVDRNFIIMIGYRLMNNGEYSTSYPYYHVFTDEVTKTFTQIEIPKCIESDLKVNIDQHKNKIKMLKHNANDNIIRCLKRLFTSTSTKCATFVNNDIVLSKSSRNTSYFTPSFYTAVYHIYPEISYKNAKEYTEGFLSGIATVSDLFERKILSDASIHIKLLDTVYVPKIWNDTYEGVLNKTAYRISNEDYKQLKTSNKITKLYKILMCNLSFAANSDKNCTELLLNEDGINRLFAQNDFAVVDPNETINSFFDNHTSKGIDKLKYDKINKELVFNPNTSDIINLFNNFIYSIGTKNREELEDNIELFSDEDNLHLFLQQTLNTVN